MKQYILKTQHTAEIAHYLRGHEGACQNIHGHSYLFVLKVSGEELVQHGPERAMIMDFSNVKRVFRQFIDSLDHTLMIEVDDQVEGLKEHFVDVHIGDLDVAINKRVITTNFRPTAENMSKIFAEYLIGQGLPVHSLEVYETRTNSAVYM